MFFMDRTLRMECGPAPARHDQATISFLFYFFNDVEKSLAPAELDHAQECFALRPRLINLRASSRVSENGQFVRALSTTAGRAGTSRMRRLCTSTGLIGLGPKNCLTRADAKRDMSELVSMIRHA